MDRFGEAVELRSVAIARVTRKPVGERGILIVNGMITTNRIMEGQHDRNCEDPPARVVMAGRCQGNCTGIRSHHREGEQSGAGFTDDLNHHIA